MPWATYSYSKKDILKHLADSARWRKEGSAYGFGIFDLKSKALCGMIALRIIDKTSQLGEIGYWVRTDSTGKGIATEASAILLCFGFQDLNLHSIRLRAATDNVASNRVAEKLGFVREGTHRQEEKLVRGWVDLHCFSLLESEYRKLKPQILDFIKSSKK